MDYIFQPSKNIDFLDFQDFWMLQLGPKTFDAPNSLSGHFLNGCFIIANRIQQVENEILKISEISKKTWCAPARGSAVNSKYVATRWFIFFKQVILFFNQKICESELFLTPRICEP